MDTPIINEKEKSTESENTSRSAFERWDGWCKRDDWAKRFKDSQNQIESYASETRTTTNITRNPDGSVYKETVTTERLPDGTSRTTRIVDTIPAAHSGQQPRHEETATTTASSKSEPSPVEDKMDQLRIHPVEEGDRLQPGGLPPVVQERRADSEDGKKEGSWTWSFWSKK